MVDLAYKVNLESANLDSVREFPEAAADPGTIKSLPLTRKEITRRILIA
jgi:hypothetical protein